MRQRCVGVLALQGGYEAHERSLRALGYQTIQVRTPQDLSADLHGLVLPGGESSTMLRLIDWNALAAPLDAFVRSGKPVLATCAGLILSATGVRNPSQHSFGWLDVDVARNAWGRQNDSFEARDDANRFELVFIRAPRIERVGEQAEVVASFNGEPVAVKAKGLGLVGAAFHPELTADLAFHRHVFGEL